MLELTDLSASVTIQDKGRQGWRRFGMPASGAMDWFAHEAANILVGNEPGAAAVEIGLGEASFKALSDCVIAVTGSGYEVENYIWTFPLWTSFYVRAGWRVTVKKAGYGNWAYLAVAGGIEAENTLGSRSAYLRGGVGQTVQVGTRLGIGKVVSNLSKLAAREWDMKKLPSYSQTPVLDVIAGPQADRFTRDGLRNFYNSEYELSASFDRMGYRLIGPRVARLDSVEMLSEGMAVGSVQIPADGQPIVMMADAPTTGGYPKIATVVRSSLPALAQCVSGFCKIRFKEVSVETAQEQLRNIHKCKD